MSSITRKIDDNISEHGSMEKYMEWLDNEIQKANQPEDTLVSFKRFETQELNQEER